MSTNSRVFVITTSPRTYPYAQNRQSRVGMKIFCQFAAVNLPPNNGLIMPKPSTYKPYIMSGGIVI